MTDLPLAEALITPLWDFFCNLRNTSTGLPAAASAKARGDRERRIRVTPCVRPLHVRVNSQKAVGGSRSEGHEIGSALDHVAQRWVDQVQSLLDATAHNSNHLDGTKSAHAGDEVRITGPQSSIETLDRGFVERKAD